MTATAFLADSFRLTSAGAVWLDAIYRLLNQLAALILIILFSPLLILIALLLWWHDGAPVLFVHHRVGRDGKVFPCYKFRTMVRAADRVLANYLERNPQAREYWNRNHKLAVDPRVTTIGWVLRRTSLDELPQLFNVLRGEMRLVGPRPVTPGELRRYGVVRWHYLSVAPGMTGLWQTSGRSNRSFEERIALDRYYVEHRGLWMDLSILCRTIPVVLQRDGAH